MHANAAPSINTIFLKNSCYLFLVNDYVHCSYGEISDGFKKKIGGYDGNACWEFAIPWKSSDIIARYENFQLMCLNSESGEELQQLEYTLGIAICGYSFLGIIADPELKVELRINGGFYKEKQIMLPYFKLPIVSHAVSDGMGNYRLLSLIL